MNRLNPHWTVVIIGTILTSVILVFAKPTEDPIPEPEIYYGITYFESGTVYEWFEHLEVSNDQTNTVSHIYLVRRQLPITEKVKVVLNRKLPETPVFTVETDEDSSLIFLEGNTLMPIETRRSAFSGEMNEFFIEKPDI